MEPRRFRCISAGGGEGGLFWWLWLLLLLLLLLELSEDMMAGKGACAARWMNLISKSEGTESDGLGVLWV